MNTSIIVPSPTEEANSISLTDREELANAQESMDITNANPTEEVVAMENASDEPLQDGPVNRPTPRLYWGIEHNDVEFVRTVIAEGADIDLWMDDEYRVRPLMRAAELGHKAIVRMLIDAGAQVDAEDILGQTAYWKAYLKKHRAIMDLLEEKGATTDFKILSKRRSAKVNAFLAWKRNRQPRP